MSQKENKRRTSGSIAQLKTQFVSCIWSTVESPQTTPKNTPQLGRKYVPQVDAVPLKSSTSARSKERYDSSTESLSSPTQTVVDGVKSVKTINIFEYKTKGTKRGEVLIINNVKFEEGQDRVGAEKDEEDLNSLMIDIGFSVKIYRNLTKVKMLDKVKKFRSKPSLSKSDISIVIMMSHGTNQTILEGSGDVVDVAGGYTSILGSDHQGLEYDDVLKEFTAKKCKSMAGKPKIFIFQCCRGSQDESLSPCSPGSPLTDDFRIKDHGDMLIAFSTLPGLFAYRYPKQGSWYIQSMIKVFREYAAHMDIETMFKLVDQKLTDMSDEYAQTSSYECRGFNKRCFLNPVKPLYNEVQNGGQIGERPVSDVPQQQVDEGNRRNHKKNQTRYVENDQEISEKLIRACMPTEGIIQIKGGCN